MSSNNIYLTEVLIKERQHDLRVEAEQEHLARIARGNRRPWWRKLTGLTDPSDHRPRGRRVAPALHGVGR